MIFIYLHHDLCNCMPMIDTWRWSLLFIWYNDIYSHMIRVIVINIWYPERITLIAEGGQNVRFGCQYQGSGMEIYELQLIVKSCVNKQAGTWLAVQQWMQPIRSQVSKLAPDWLHKIENKSEVRTASWPNSWQVLPLISFHGPGGQGPGVEGRQGLEGRGHRRGQGPPRPQSKV